MQQTAFYEITHLRNSSVNLPAVYPLKYKLLVKILSSLLNTMLIVDEHCSDEFPVPQIDRKSKQVKTVKILFAISMGKDSLF